MKMKEAFFGMYQMQLLKNHVAPMNRAEGVSINGTSTADQMQYRRSVAGYRRVTNFAIV